MSRRLLPVCCGSIDLLQLIVFQVQFLSTLHLVDANTSTAFDGLLNELKWLNLHLSPDVGTMGCGNEASLRVCRTVGSVVLQGLFILVTSVSVPVPDPRCEGKD